MKKIEITLKNNIKAWATLFDRNDYDKMIKFLREIRMYNMFLNDLGGRKINIPDVISEGMYCYNFNAVRTNRDAGSYDCVDIKTKDGIQVKSASIEDDLTSFGPNSKWDKLIFVDYSRFMSNESNQIDFYLIKIDIQSLILCKTKNQTFADQQKQGRRPRLSIKKLIKVHNIPKIKTIKI